MYVLHFSKPVLAMLFIPINKKVLNQRLPRRRDIGSAALNCERLTATTG